MYRAEEKLVSSENGLISVWGIADEYGFIIDFTGSRNIAEEIADIINENNVERIHIAEIIEDMFYSV